MALSNYIIFPPFRLDLAGQQLHCGEKLIPLRPKAFAVLQYLLSHPGQLITKTELLDDVWPETAVSDTVLKVCIREIREALEDDAELPRFVETVHRKGYRFIGNIRTNNLPAPLTSFVGRERETADLKRLLQEDVRLLTLTGAGGSGKTRLATQVLQELIAQHGVEVWWVDLAPLTEESLVPQAITSALAIRDHAGKEPIQTLCDYLRSRRLTLVLDNCEHVLQTAASIVKTLLQTCSQLTIVATSRERLGINGEMEFPVSPMTLPDNPREEVDQLLKSDAIRLFAVRAVAASSRFELTQHNAKSVVELCQRLDGIPLAIELAAARLKALTVEQLVMRLDSGLVLLASAGRSESPRHQTLRATIDWSYNLLSEQERALQRRLSVFAGDWTLEAAEEVCASDGIDDSDVLDLLSHLIDKSLVLRAEDQGQARYRLLETIKQYSGNKLDEANETESMQRRHTAYYVQFAETIAPRINTVDRQYSLSQLAAEHDNMRAAFRYAAQNGEAETALRLCDALFFFWFYLGYWSEGRSWLADALSRSNDLGKSELRGRAMRSDGVLASFMGDHLVARARLEESVSIHRQTGDRSSLAAALVFLSYELLEKDPDHAHALVEEGIDLCRQTNDRFVLAMSLNHSAAVAFVRRDYPGAQIRYAEAVALGRELKDNLPIGGSLRGLGHVAIRQRQYELAASHLTEGLLALRNIGDKYFVSRALDTIAEMHSAKGDYERAARLLGASAAAQEAVGASMFEFYRDEYERLIRGVGDALGEEVFNLLWTEGRAQSFEQAIEYALGGLVDNRIDN